MAEKTISILASTDNPIVYEISGIPAVSSRDVALRFQKKHKHILEEIRRIQSMVPKDFYEPNFRPVTYQDSKGQDRPAFMLSRDAFSLLAMGFTGKAAINWKLKYIEAFNAMERQLLRSARLTASSRALSLTPSAKSRMRKVLSYRERGFTYTEIAKVMGIHTRAVGRAIRTARELGLEVSHEAV